MTLRILACALALIACTAETPTKSEVPSAPAPAPEFQLPRPQVVMRADPAPPFTYWAPDGAIITNHPDVPGIWFADVDGRRVASYYGDACHASRMQQFVGEPLQSLPAPPADAEWRTSCSGCAVNGDLRSNRVNILFNAETQLIEQIACY